MVRAHFRHTELWARGLLSLVPSETELPISRLRDLTHASCSVCIKSKPCCDKDIGRGGVALVFSTLRTAVKTLSEMSISFTSFVSYIAPQTLTSEIVLLSPKSDRYWHPKRCSKLRLLVCDLPGPQYLSSWLRAMILYLMLVSCFRSLMVIPNAVFIIWPIIYSSTK